MLSWETMMMMMMMFHFFAGYWLIFVFQQPDVTFNGFFFEEAVIADVHGGQSCVVRCWLLWFDTIAVNNDDMMIYDDTAVE